MTSRWTRLWAAAGLLFVAAYILVLARDLMQRRAPRSLRRTPLSPRDVRPAVRLGELRIGAVLAAAPNRHRKVTDTCALGRYRRARGWRVVPRPRMGGGARPSAVSALAAWP